MKDKISKVLSKIKIRSLTKKEASAVWLKISKNIDHKPETMRSSFNYRFLGRAFASALLILVVSVPTARATNNAKPGDFLFPIDRALEEVQLFLASEEKRDKLKLEFAEERVSEVRAVLAKINSDGSDDQNESLSESGSNQNQGQQKRAEKAIVTALNFIISVQEDLETKNKTQALSALADVIDNLAANLPEDSSIEIKLKNEKQNIAVKVSLDTEGKKVLTKIKKDGEAIKIGGSKSKAKPTVKSEEKNPLSMPSYSDEDNAGSNGQSSNNKKILICHVPPGNHDKRKTISVSQNALSAHLGHGDFEGSCEEGDDQEDNDEENTPPTIVLLGSNPINLLLNTAFTDPGATANDPEDGDISDNIVVGGDVVDTATPGTYIITYDVSDSQELMASQVTRTVNVNEALNVAPEIVLLGDSSVELTVGDTFTDPGATANDPEDGDISDNIVVGGDVVDTGVAGVYIVTYDVTDSAGLTAEQATRTVNVGEVPKQCSDNEDNDGDSLIDENDSGCHSDGDSSNVDSYDPEDNDETDDSLANVENVDQQSNGTKIATAKSQGKGPKTNNGKNDKE